MTTPVEELTRWIICAHDAPVWSITIEIAGPWPIYRVDVIAWRGVPGATYILRHLIEGKWEVIGESLTSDEARDMAWAALANRRELA